MNKRAPRFRGMLEKSKTPVALGVSARCVVQLEVDFSEEDDPVEVEAEEPSSQSETESAVSMANAVGTPPVIISNFVFEPRLAPIKRPK